MESSFGVRKNAFALFLTVLYISETSICHAYHTTKSPKIVIVGAGPAGIAAASKLFEYGFKNVTILEAESRIGGRVYTEQIGKLFDFCFYTKNQIQCTHCKSILMHRRTILIFETGYTPSLYRKIPS